MKNQSAPIDVKKILRELPVITSLAPAVGKEIRKLEYRTLDVSFEHVYDYDLEKAIFLVKIYGKDPDQKSIAFLNLDITKAIGRKQRKDWHTGEEITFIIWPSGYKQTPRSVHERKVPPEIFEKIISDCFLTIDETMELCEFLFISEQDFKSTERLSPFDFLNDRLDLQVRYRIYRAAEQIHHAFLRCY